MTTVATSKIEPRVLIVGSGTTGRELLKRLVDIWRVSIVDTDEKQLRLVDDTIDPTRVLQIAGDGTSRLILRQAGIEHVDYIIAVTGSDDVNLEVCRLARDDFEKTNLFAAVVNFSERDRYRDEGIDFVTPSYAAAVALENRILHGVGTSLSTGEGRGEVVEVRVLPSSPMIGQTLSSVRPNRWHVGAIYRDEKLVVPYGQTRIAQDDRVILIGEPEILPSIAKYFRIGEPEFPLEFGSQVLVLTESSSYFENIADELRYILNHTQERGVEILYWPHEPRIQSSIERINNSHRINASTVAVFGDYGDVTAKHVVTKDCGLLVVPDTRFRFLERIGFRRTAMAEIFRQMEAPLAVLRGTHPYHKMLLPVTDTGSSMKMARVAIDLARTIKAKLTVVSVSAPRFVVGVETIQNQKAALAKVKHLAGLFHLDVEHIQLEGNPIEEVLKICPDYQMIVVSHSKNRKPSFFNPDTSQHLLRRSPITTLVLPV